MDVRLNTIDYKCERRAQVSVPATSTVAQVRPQILESLCLPRQEYGGEEVTWLLSNDSAPNRPLLADSDVVRDVLRTGQTVKVIPNMIAGR